MTTRFVIDLAIVVLACVGLWVTVDRAAAWLVRVWGWLWRDRVTPLLEDEAGDISEDCASGEHWECEGCWCECGHDIDLPPERSREELGFTGPLEPDIHCNHCTDGCVRCDPRKQDEYRWSPHLERRAPWWEAEHRAAYESMGFDYPSGLMARVREAAP